MAITVSVESFLSTLEDARQLLKMAVNRMNANNPNSAIQFARTVISELESISGVSSEGRKAMAGSQLALVRPTMYVVAKLKEGTQGVPDRVAVETAEAMLTAMLTRVTAANKTVFKKAYKDVLSYVKTEMKQQFGDDKGIKGMSEEYGPGNPLWLFQYTLPQLEQAEPPYKEHESIFQGIEKQLQNHGLKGSEYGFLSPEENYEWVPKIQFFAEAKEGESKESKSSADVEAVDTFHAVLDEIASSYTASVTDFEIKSRLEASKSGSLSMGQKDNHISTQAFETELSPPDLLGRWPDLSEFNRRYKVKQSTFAQMSGASKSDLKLEGINPDMRLPSEVKRIDNGEITDTDHQNGMHYTHYLQSGLSDVDIDTWAIESVAGNKRSITLGLVRI